MEKKIVCAVFDFNFMGGSMGMAAGEAIVTACEFAKRITYLLLFSVPLVERECKKEFCH